MKERATAVGNKALALANGISKLPSFLIGLLIIFVIAGGGYLAWKALEACEGKSWTECLLGAINPIPPGYLREVGTPLGCAPNEDLDVALCYPKCPAGYKGVGPVCWQQCPAGYRDDGAFCAKPASYGRGAGYPWKFGDGVNDKGMFSRCEKDHGKGGCEKDGAIVYPKCRSGYQKVGCCVCSPICPGGMTDIGVSCTKKTQGRTAGKPIHACPADKEKVGLLCYDRCKDGHESAGLYCKEVKG